MKIAIMSWFQYHNYGTALQITALSQWLKNNGHDSYIVNYEESKKPVFLHTKSVINDALRELIERVKNHPYHRYEEKKREELFRTFLKTNNSFSKRCELMSELETLNSEYEAFICGSDQIWSPNVFNPHYFLDYVRDPEKMIAYAPSVGLPKISDNNVRNRIQQLSSRFVHISTRERQGSVIIEKLIGRKVETVIDPTLLLSKEEWDRIANNYANGFKPYILVYMLGKNGRYWKYICRISKKLGYEIRIVPVYFKDLHREGCCKDAVGPAEFLSLIKNASFVATDSFHGLAFAIKYEKDFCVFERFSSSDKLNQNSRIYNLMRVTGTRSRLFSNNIKNIIKKKIDYSAVNHRLEKEIEKSKHFLFSSLSAVERHNSIKACNNIKAYSSLCCGCGACTVACPKGIIEVSLSKSGFLEAEIDDNMCISCGKCVSVCPYINIDSTVDIKNASLFSFITKDNDALMTSSSGGFGDSIAKNAINHEAEVIGCVFDSYEHRAKHVVVNKDDTELFRRLRGSKYIQSDIASVMPLINKVSPGSAVIGTPCQIAGVRALLGKRDDVLLVDLICHGVPSYNLYKKYLEYINDKLGIDVTDGLETIFRYKEKGWRNRYIYNTNQKKSFCKSQNKDPYFLSFEHGLCYSPSCYECPWRNKSAADLRMGDYWHKKYKNNNTGISMVLAFTKLGLSSIYRIKERGFGFFIKENIQDYYDCQQTVNNPRPVFWEEYIDELNGEKDLEEILKKYVLPFDTRKKVRSKISKIGELVRK